VGNLGFHSEAAPGMDGLFKTNMYNSNHKHIRLYLKHFGEPETCEACEKYLNGCCDFHHIECRGMGGTKEPERIENIMAVCRDCHTKYGDKKQWKYWLFSVHKIRLEARKKPFDLEWIEGERERHKLVEGYLG